ncbi:MAG: pyruvate kinase [Nitrospiraceae bacterium]|nr:MAG: pyruvate kinase [Nitrospiraceae bacterium]
MSERKARIVCTLGPASSSRKLIRQMITAGMNVARLNFSHGTYDTHKQVFEAIRAESRKSGTPIAVLQDLKGLKIRIGSVKNGAVILQKNSSLTLTSKNIQGDSRQIQIVYPNLLKDVHPGNSILIDDGLIQLKVTGKRKDSLTAKVIEGGILRERKGVNLPGVNISAPSFTQKDLSDLTFGIKLGVDYIALSFVCSANDVIRVKDHLKRKKRDIPVIAKIETRQALENIEDIIDASDGLMIARGDLGVEIPPEEVPMVQKRLLQMCNSALKPVIIATQMLESMTEHMRPTRAETTDVANGVLDGADALMLSAETSVGKYPVETIRMMDRIISFTESQGTACIPPLVKENSKEVSQSFKGKRGGMFARAIAEAACSSAANIKAKTIVAFSMSGFTALLVSKFRPEAPITCFTASENVLRRMALYWGVSPHVMKFPDNTDRMISESEKALLKKRIVKKGDPVTIIAASPFSRGEKSNIMKLHKVGIR